MCPQLPPADSLTSPLPHSLLSFCFSQISLFIVLGLNQALSCLRTFAVAVFSAWDVLYPEYSHDRPLPHLCVTS